MEIRLYVLLTFLLATCILKVYSQSNQAPIFSKEMVNCKTWEGSGVMFEVQIEGADEVVWQCGGEDIDFEEEKRCTTEEEEGGVYKLLISEVEIDDTDCAYQCVAKNSAGQTISEAKVFVEEMPSM